MAAVGQLNNVFEPNRRIQLRVSRIGKERTPLVVLDDFLANPHLLLEHAVWHNGFRPVSGNLYPGIRAALPRTYMSLLFACLPEIVLKAFGLGDLDTRRVEGDFSIVTTPREDLELLQCIPHIDTVDAGQIAVLHYLGRPEHGGTAFYRHRRTGFESVSAARLPAYEQAIDADLRAFGHPGRNYIYGDTPMFERIANVGAAFNRLVLYPSMALHSGSISPNYRFDADPATGRLTANVFLHFRADR